MERSMCPSLLRLVCVCDFPRDIFVIVCHDGVQVVCGGRVVSGDVFSAFEW